MKKETERKKHEEAEREDPEKEAFMEGSETAKSKPDSEVVLVEMERRVPQVDRKEVEIDVNSDEPDHTPPSPNCKTCGEETNWMGCGVYKCRGQCGMLAMKQ